MKKDLILKHDPEKAPITGDWGVDNPVVDENKCIGCNKCVDFCPDACIAMKEVKKEIAGKKMIRKVSEIDTTFCKGCGVCEKVCPVKAILMKRK